MKFSKKQKQILKYIKENDPLHIILEGAVRSGKTRLNNVLFIAHVNDFKYQKKDFIVTSRTIGSLERNVLKPMRDDYGIKTNLDKYNRFNMFGNKINCFGSDTDISYKAISGFTSYGWYGNEITLHNDKVIKECFNRNSGDGFRIFWDTNPDYPEHMIKTDYIDISGCKLENGRERIHSWHFTLDDNEFLSEIYTENLKRSTPKGMWYNRSILGLWVAAEGVVYENFDKETHVIEPFKIPDEWERVRGNDFGYTNPFCMLWGAIDNDGRLYIYQEHYKAQTLIEDHVKQIKMMQDYNKYNKPISYSWTVADHDAQERAEYVKHDVYTKAAIKDVKIGIQKVAERLVIQPDGKPRLYIFSNCKNLIKEMGSYVWEEKKEGKPYKEEPVKVNDHAVDTLRYIIAELDIRGKLSASIVSASDLGL